MKRQNLTRAGGLTLIALAGGVAASGAQAQGFFGSLEGRYVLVGKSQLDALSEDQMGNPLLTLGSSVQPKDGWGGRVFLGYRFANNWDIGVGGSGAWLGKRKSSTNNGDTLDPETEDMKVKGKQWAIDLEAGYNIGVADMGANLRLFGGLRYARITQDGSGHYHGFFALAGQTTHDITYDVSSRYWGIGPVWAPKPTSRSASSPISASRLRSPVRHCSDI